MNFETDEDIRIKAEAEEMMETFLIESKKPPYKAQWKKDYKNRAMHLLWKCNLHGRVPPVGLVMLVGCLFGDRHDWPVVKYAVINLLAEKYDPRTLGKKPQRGVRADAARIIREYGGTLKTPRPLDEEEDENSRNYAKTFDGWCEDSLFLEMWAKRRLEVKPRRRLRTGTILNIANSILKKSA